MQLPSSAKSSSSSSSPDICFVIKTFEMEDITFATVRCPICSDNIKIHTKITNKINSWIIAKFVAHLKKKHRDHFNINECKQTTNASLYNYFDSEACSSKCPRTSTYSSPSDNDQSKIISKVLKTSRNATTNMSIIDDKQQPITSYFELIDPMVKIINDNGNAELKDCINEIVSSGDNANITMTTLITSIFKECEKKNISKYENRYSEYLKNVATYLFILGGRQLYEILSANLKLPSTSSVMKYIEKTPNVAEAEIFAKELKEFLLKRNLPLKMFISEDGTKIVPSVKFDAKTSQLIGKYIFGTHLFLVVTLLIFIF